MVTLIIKGILEYCTANHDMFEERRNYHFQLPVKLNYREYFIRGTHFLIFSL